MPTTSGQDGRIPPTAIARLRRQARVTQEQLAERSGVSVRTVRNLDSGGAGMPRWDSVRRVAQALQVRE